MPLKCNGNRVNSFENRVYHSAPKLGTSRCRATSQINHYNDVIMITMASQITSLKIVYSIVYSGADQRKHQSSASLAFVPGIHRGPVNSQHKWPVTWKMFPFDDVIMYWCIYMLSRVNPTFWYLLIFLNRHHEHSKYRNILSANVEWRHLENKTYPK